jgi:hypothetical protein
LLALPKFKALKILLPVAFVPVPLMVKPLTVPLVVLLLDALIVSALPVLLTYVWVTVPVPLVRVRFLLAAIVIELLALIVLVPFPSTTEPAFVVPMLTTLVPLELVPVSMSTVPAAPPLLLPLLIVTPDEREAFVVLTVTTPAPWTFKAPLVVDRLDAALPIIEKAPPLVEMPALPVIRPVEVSGPLIVVVTPTLPMPMAVALLVPILRATPVAASNVGARKLVSERPAPEIQKTAAV